MCVHNPSFPQSLILILDRLAFVCLYLNYHSLLGKNVSNILEGVFLFSWVGKILSLSVSCGSLTSSPRNICDRLL